MWRPPEPFWKRLTERKAQVRVEETTKRNSDTHHIRRVHGATARAKRNGANARCEVIAAAKEGFKAVGYELNPWLVWYSRYRAWRAGMHHNAKFYISDLWKVSFSQYTNVVVFGVPQMMPQLEKKLEEELVHNARVVACRFPFPHWMPDHTTGEGIDVVWAYDSKAFKGNLKTCSETLQKMHPL
ncbi:ATP synthase subunit C lysine N-methyltransferase isoform X6 [Natator depressus]|uniref:ATP synthase subunit C lysine N-methyltransferase isoform X6 n=1 Tax=Natator depressus TaxID=27790 RepID=UPI003EBE4F57